MDNIPIDQNKHKCTNCGVIKPKAQFTKHVKSPSGIRRRCKPCNVKAAQASQLKRKLLNNEQ